VNKITGYVFTPEEFAACEGIEDAANNIEYADRFTWRSEMGDCYTLGYLWEMECGVLRREFKEKAQEKEEQELTKGSGYYPMEECNVKRR